MYGNSLQDELDQQKALTAKYQQENQQLHAIIVNHCRQESDPWDDGDIATKFAALESEIFQQVKRHFPAKHGLTGWSEYDNVGKLDDRNFFLQAHVATATAQAFFSHDARLFGLDEETYRHLAAFEKLLEDSHVPTAEIKQWRLQTTKVARMTPNTTLNTQSITAPRKLLDHLKEVHTQVSPRGTWPRAKEALDELFQSAHDLALAIRSCKAEFEWKQAVPPASLNEPAVTRIDGYSNTWETGPKGEPVDILFGPVYKRVDGRLVLLRIGTVLFG